MNPPTPCPVPTGSWTGSPLALAVQPPHPRLLQHLPEAERPHGSSLRAQCCWHRHRPRYRASLGWVAGTESLYSPVCVPNLCYPPLPGSVGGAISVMSPDVYISDDGGYTWARMLEGPHHYAILDSGGLIVAIEHTSQPVNIIEYVQVPLAAERGSSLVFVGIAQAKGGLGGAAGGASRTT